MKRYLFSALVMVTTLGAIAPSAQAAETVLRSKQQPAESLVAIAKTDVISHSEGITQKETAEITQTKGFRRGGRGFRRRGFRRRGFGRRGFGRRGFRRGHH